MELAQSLLRACARTFYETKHCIVIDALIIHSVCRDDDLAYMMGMHPKELHKICGRLKEDRFLVQHTRAEQKGEQARQMNRTYYYIDYRATIDAIKWRVYLMNKNVQGNTVPADERKEYFCKRCKSEWTQIEVLDKWDPSAGFLCHKCGYTLEHDPDSNRGGHEQSTKYHAQFRFITDLLPKLDEVIIPENKFENAMAARLEVERDDTNPASQTAPVTTSSAKPTTVHGMRNSGPTSIAVTLTTDDGPTVAELAAEQAMKEKIALQNAMPVHFTHSTVTGEQVKFNNQPTFSSTQSKDADKKTVLTPSANDDNAEMDEYFARLKAEQAKEAEREQDEEYETDNDDEEDFEDVVPTASGSGIGTPLSSNGDAKPTSTHGNGLPGVLKRSASAISSGVSTSNSSPTGTPNSDRAAKKVRIEEPIAPVMKQEDEESEEDMEFEDV